MSLKNIVTEFDIVHKLGLQTTLYNGPYKHNNKIIIIFLNFKCARPSGV